MTTTFDRARSLLSRSAPLLAGLSLALALPACSGGGGGAAGGNGGGLGAFGNGNGNGNGNGGGNSCAAVNGKKPLGAACTSDTECSGGVCAVVTSQNSTSGVCSKQCTKDADCGGGSAGCVPGANLCAVACKTAADCCSGVACTDVGVGTPICYGTAGGNGGGNPPGGGGGACGLVGGKKPTGGDCTGGGDCAGSVCLNLKFTNKQNKAHMCSQACTTNADCGGGALCVSTGNVSFCAAPCGSSKDCCDGFVCIDAGNGQGVCFVQSA